MGTIKVKMIVEENGADDLVGRVTIDDNLVITEGTNLEDLKKNMTGILRKFHSLGDVDIEWEIMWEEPNPEEEDEEISLDTNFPGYDSELQSDYED